MQAWVHAAFNSAADYDAAEKSQQERPKHGRGETRGARRARGDATPEPRLAAGGSSESSRRELPIPGSVSASNRIIRVGATDGSGDYR